MMAAGTGARVDGVADAPPGLPVDPDGFDAVGVPRPLVEPHASETDAEQLAWLRRIVLHDEAALGALYRCTCSRVFRQALRLVHDVATAEEVVEDVFWQVWRQAPRYDPARGCVGAWLAQITRSRALDALRARGRNPLHEALDLDGALGDVAAADCNPQEQLDSSRIAACVQEALAALQPLHRQLVALAFVRGYTQSEIAAQTGMPLGTVKSHLRRGLATMKLALLPRLQAAIENRGPA